MKITRIETIVLNLPMQIERATPMLGGRARTSIDMLLVRVETDAGLTGWGEAFGHRIFHATRAAIDTLVGPMFVGRDPSQILASHDEVQRVLHGVGRNGATMYALSGIDIALWDIAGKAAGVPLYRLLRSGWGEAFGHRIFHATRAAIDTLVGPMFVGRDPSQILASHDEVQRVLHGVGRNGATMYALSGIDIALWDIAGKAAGVPLYRLLRS